MRGALVVLMLLVQPVRAESACDPKEVEELRAHLDGQARHARTWNITWAAIFGGAAVGTFTVALANPFPDLQVGLYASSAKASVGALARVILPLRIARPELTGDACTDPAALRKAVQTAAKRERGNFWLNHIGGVLVNGAGALAIWKYGTGSQALLSIATGYPVGLLSNYTAPRGSWKLYREREAMWAPIVSAREDGWSVGVAGAF